MLLALGCWLLANDAMAQPASLDMTRDTLVSAADTIALQARHTTILAEMAGGSYTISIDEPAEGYIGMQVTVVQLNASGVTQLTLNTVAAAGNEFQASNTATSSHAFTAGTYEVATFVCMEVAAATLKWVKIR